MSEQQAEQDKKLFDKVSNVAWGDLRLINILPEETRWNIVSLIKSELSTTPQEGEMK